MIIACLGWGSLIWDPRSLPIKRKWFNDGPFARIEFSRKSSDKRLTLVIDEQAQPVRLLWAQMDLIDVDEAIYALKEREGLTAKDWKKDIGIWKTNDSSPTFIKELPLWAKTQGVDAVIWTALKPKFDKDGKRPSKKQVISHLRELKGATLENAKRYVQFTPAQIDTEYRRSIESELGWNCLSTGP